MARLAPSLALARDEVNAGWPRRDKTSDGWIGDAAHQATGSDHNPGARDLVHALDVDEDLDGRNVEDGSELYPWLDWLRVMRDPRIKYVIYESMMFASYNSVNGPAWTWRPYRGTNAHARHGHISILSTVAAENDLRSWFPRDTSLTPPPAYVAGISSKEDDEYMASYMVRREGNPDVYLIDGGTRTLINSEAAVKRICDERPEIRHAGRVQTGPRKGIPNAIPWAGYHVDIYPPRRGKVDQ